MRRCIAVESEKGSVTVLVVLLLPFILAISAIALDVTNWYLHHRHLQTQADAAALAGGAMLQSGTCDNASVFAEAIRYSGDEAAGSDLNLPVSRNATTTLSFEREPDPCAAGAVETLISEVDIPWIFNVFGLDRTDISTSARVQLNEISELDGALPLAIKDQRVQDVTFLVVDEDQAVGNAARYLGASTVTTALDPDEAIETWSNVTDPISVAVTVPNVGIRVSWRFNGETACAATDFRCFDEDSVDLAADDGVIHVHGFEVGSAVTTGSPVGVSAPSLTKVDLLNATCANNQALHEGGCNVSVRVRVDWLDVIDAALAATSTVNAVSAIGGINARLGSGAITSLTYKKSGVDGINYARWEGTLPTGATAGPVELELGWFQKTLSVKNNTQNRTCGTTGNVRPCIGYFLGTAAKGVYSTSSNTTAQIPNPATPVHRTFVKGTTRTGDLEFAALVGSVADSYSVSRCATVASCTPTEFVVSVGLPGPLRIGDRVALSFGDVNNGSNQQLLRCNGSPDVGEYIARGCDASLAVSPDDECTGTDTTDVPATCVEVYPSAGNSQAVEKGVTRRVYYGGDDFRPKDRPDCSADVNLYDDNDPDAWRTDLDSSRIVAVVIARDPGQGGDEDLPIKSFAAFYITGWNDNPCEGQGNNETVTDTGVILGRFIQYAFPNDGGITGTDPCESAAIAACVPIMTE